MPSGMFSYRRASLVAHRYYRTRLVNLDSAKPCEPSRGRTEATREDVASRYV